MMQNDEELPSGSAKEKGPISSEFQEALKRFVKHGTTSSWNERHEILRDVNRLWKNEATGISDGPLHTILRNVAICLPRYLGDALSVKELLLFIRQILETKPKGNYVAYFDMLAGLARIVTASESTSYTRKLSRAALKMALLVHPLVDFDDANWKTNVEIQSQLLFSGPFKMRGSEERLMSSRIVEATSKKDTSRVNHLIAFLTREDATIYSAGFLDLLGSFFRFSERQTYFDAGSAASVARYFARVSFSTKNPLSGQFLTLSKSFLGMVDSSSFKDHLLSPMVKALLRNPEIVLPAVLAVLSGMKIDLSESCMEIGKQLAALLHSKVDQSRRLSVQGCEMLAEKCKDPAAVLKLVTHIFGVLGVHQSLGHETFVSLGHFTWPLGRQYYRSYGSEGKITAAPERVDLYSGIGKLSSLSMDSIPLAIAGPVCSQYITAVASESQEVLAVHAISTLGSWASKVSEVPPELQRVLKTIETQKSPPVRSAYLMCINRIAGTDNSSRLPGLEADLIPVLLKIVEAAAKKPSDVQLTLEALPAAALILASGPQDQKSEQRLKPFWNAILDSEKQLFTSDKFLLSSLSFSAQECLLTLVERLFLGHAGMLREAVIKMYFGALAYVLLAAPHALRTRAMAVWEKILSLAGLNDVTEVLVECLKMNLVKLKSVDADKSKEGDEKKEINYSQHALVALIKLAELCVKRELTVEAKSRFMVACLLLTHEPGIVSLRPDLWIDLLRRFHRDNLFPDKLVSDSIEEICRRLLAENLLPESAVEGSVKTATAFPTAASITVILSAVKESLRKPENSAVTLEEYHIFQTPTGTLYDKSVLEADSKGDSAKGNVKRESKAYSYKEQQAEIELRKELEAKKKAQLGGKEPPLTPKQKEAMTKQLAKENTTRLAVQTAVARIRRPFLILDAVIAGNPDYMRGYLSEVIALVGSLLHAPLTAPLACATWNLMSRCADEALRKNGLATSLAITTLRVLEPAFALPALWSQEKLSAAITRVIHGLFLLCGPNDEMDSTEDGSETPSVISVPDVCYAFPLIQIVVDEENSKRLGLKENVAAEAFKVLCKVLEICATEERDRSAVLAQELENENPLMEIVENNPAYLPLSEILRTLVSVGVTGYGKLEAETSVALLHFAKVVSIVVANGSGKLEQDYVKQLLNLLLSPKGQLRIAAIQALLILGPDLEEIANELGGSLDMERRLFVAAHDVDDTKIAEFSRELFQDLNLRPTESLLFSVLEETVYNKEFLRNSAAATLGSMLPYFRSSTAEVLDRLIKMYSKNIEDCKVKVDKFGRATGDSQVDQWPTRRGIAMALTRIAPCLTDEELLGRVMDFLLRNPCTLKDEKASVRNDMLQVGVTVVELHGKSHVVSLITKFEEFLTNAPKTGDYDVVRQNAIVIMGNLAKHLDPRHTKIRPIVQQLLAALSTPSEEVQKAVGSCIAPLVVTIEEDIKSVVPNLLHVLYESDSYAHRRGAAYGLAGIFQGLGIMSLKDYDIMLTIMDGLQEKKNTQRRESSLLAIAMLSQGLGRVFEPFIMQALPYVLQSIGDGNVHVRQSAEEASKMVMSQLTGPGVRLILPTLLKGLEEDAWRAKSAAIEMLGDMAYCAPTQLSSGLPMVVPKLIDTLGDSHTKVQESAVSSLKKIASVIKNPEVVGLVPGILVALQDPAKKTASCLKTILQTQFIHIIDAASLALLMPVVRRAIYDRGSENRKLSAQIMASLYSLADQKDLLPYLDGILPGLKNCLLDPAPEVRLCAAKALAALVKGTGESGFDQLKDWLFSKLVSENNSVDRSGAAQGLAESLGVLGVHKLRQMVPQFFKIILNEQTPSHVRDGYLLVFVYLPVVFGQQFSPFITDLIPAILLGLADDTEYVRETALQSGQRIVNFFADSAIELLLPKLEEGMFDENWRIRFASVQLLGDLLYKISGASGKHTTAGLEEDENFGTEQSHSAILARLGETHRNRVLAGLYISRSDNALVVRQAALHVWKVIVTNTPKTLREILPELFEILLDALASDNEERRQVAGKTLGDLVRKLGERILPDIIPILQAGLDSEKDQDREGVCVGLMEIISSSSKETVTMYCDILEPTLSKALLDKNPGVRRAAADAFCMLDNVVGHKILDDILPVLFDKVTDEVEGDNALDGLQQIMARRSRVVLPYLIPRLTTPPVNTKTLALLTAVAGEALSKHLGKVLPSLLASLQTKMGTPEEEQELGYCRSVILSVDDEVGVSTLVDTLMTGAQNEKTRLAAVALLGVFFANTKVDIRGFFATSIRQLMRLYVSDDPVLIKKVAVIIGTLIKKSPTDIVYDNVSALRTAIRAIHMELRVPCIPGLCLPEGAAVFIPMLRDALLSVSADEKELIGQTIGDLVRLSNDTGLKSSVLTITGPIIRILGDRYAPNVRTVLLDALNALIEKTTVSRALSDTTRSVRVKAGIIAANIAPMHPRLDALANDLLEVAKTNADLSTKETSFRSLRLLLGSAGGKLSAQYRADVVGIASRYLDAEEGDLKRAAAGVLGALCRFAVDDELATLLKSQIYDVSSNAEWNFQHGHSLALGAALREAGGKLVSDQYADSTMDVILKHHTSDRTPIVATSTRCMGLYLMHQRKTNQPLNKKLLIVLAKSFNHVAIEVKQLVAHICSHLALVVPEPLDISEMKLLIPQIVNGTKEKNTAVRYDSEMALADVLALRKDETVFESVKGAMDAGARESLQNARRSVSKSVLQNVTKLEELDETV